MNVSFNKQGVVQFPLKVKAVAVLGRNVISIGLTVKSGGIGFFKEPPKNIKKNMNKKQYEKMSKI